MRDKFGRNINYMRISVTDRCNLRCVYCMPEEGVKPITHDEVLRYEEILQVVKATKDLGITHIRITGGEPLVRKNLVSLIRRIKSLGIDDLSLTTNGTLLAPLARSFKEAGLDRVNISLDTLDPEKFRAITRCGNLKDTLNGINAAIQAGLHPVKINMVVIAGLNEDEICDMARLTYKLPVHVRFIEVMPIGPDPSTWKEARITLPQIVTQVKRLGKLRPVRDIKKAGPSETFRLAGAKGTIGFIAALSRPFCQFCNRIRLTADGKIRPCLASDIEVDIKPILRNDFQNNMELNAQLVQAFCKALDLKPKEHQLTKYYAHARRMCQIGG